MIQDTARAGGDQVAAQLRDYLQAISEKRSTDAVTLSKDQQTRLTKFAQEQLAKVKKISEDAAKEIANLPAFSEGVSDARRAELIAERAGKIAQIRKTAIDGLSQLAAETKSGSADIAAGTVANREVVIVQLKTMVEKARIDYQTRKESLTAQ